MLSHQTLDYAPNHESQVMFVTHHRDTSKLRRNQQIYLSMRTGILSIQVKQEVTLGRVENNGGSTSFVDLSTFGAEQSGISREHAKLIVNDSGQIYIMDLGSTNGTYVNEEQLNPSISYPLDNGDVLRLGSCVAHVLFEENMFTFA